MTWDWIVLTPKEGNQELEEHAKERKMVASHCAIQGPNGSPVNQIEDLAILRIASDIQKIIH